MMKSIIICEGETDFALLQYFMITVNGWQDSGKYAFKPLKESKSRDFIKGSNLLTIISSDGCTNIKEVFSAVIRYNQNAVSNDERYSKVVILTDNDEEDSESKIITDLQAVITNDNELKNNEWSSLSFNDMTDNKDSFSIELLLLIIPFEENGALETFLLNAVSKQDNYDAEIIRKGNAFVENSDPESKYLKHRYLKTKAKFDVYFSIRTPAKQFAMRQNILKNVPWEQYESICEAFKELKKLDK